MAFTPFSAKNAQVRVGTDGSNAAQTTTVFTAKKWDVTPKVDRLETTHFELTTGTGDYIAGIKDFEASVSDADWDGAANPYDNPPNIRNGTKIALKLFVSINGTSPFWHFSSFLVDSSPSNADVRSAMKISFSGIVCGSGTITYPTGNAA